MNILAIESSCDETAAAVIKDGTEILSSVVASSTAMHEKWGGIVPEVAAREQLASILPVLTEVLQQISGTKTQKNKGIKKIIDDSIDAIAVTVGPGLVGSLLIGVEAAKTIAFVTGKPIIPVNHVLAHMYANFLQDHDNSKTILYPAISLVVSGGHTELFLMKSANDLKWLGGTIDDAAGEAFDKTARLLGFGSRGGVAIQEAASQDKVLRCRTPTSIHLPRPMMHDKTLNFSFSGLKTAILREVNIYKQTHQLNNSTIKLLSYEIQEAITDVLVIKTLKAAELHHAKSILISGGVAANLCLRNKFLKTIHDQQSPLNFFCPPIELCTDNAAYIGSYAFFRGNPEDWHTVTAIPDLPVEV